MKLLALGVFGGLLFFRTESGAACAPVELANVQSSESAPRESGLASCGASTEPLEPGTFFKPHKGLMKLAIDSLSACFSTKGCWFSRFCEGFHQRPYLDSKIAGKRALDWIFSAWALIELGDDALIEQRREFLDATIFGLVRAESISKAKARQQKHCQPKESVVEASEIFAFPLMREAFALAADQVRPEELITLFTKDVYCKLLTGNYEAFSRFSDWALFPESLVDRVFALGRGLMSTEAGSYDIWPLNLPRLIETASSKVVLKVVSDSSYDLYPQELYALVQIRGPIEALTSDPVLGSDPLFRAMMNRWLMMQSLLSGGDLFLQDASLEAAEPAAKESVRGKASSKKSKHSSNGKGRRSASTDASPVPLTRFTPGLETQMLLSNSALDFKQGTILAIQTILAYELVLRYALEGSLLKGQLFEALVFRSEFMNAFLKRFRRELDSHPTASAFFFEPLSIRVAAALRKASGFNSGNGQSFQFADSLEEQAISGLQTSQTLISDNYEAFPDFWRQSEVQKLATSRAFVKEFKALRGPGSILLNWLISEAVPWPKGIDSAERRLALCSIEEIGSEAFLRSRCTPTTDAPFLNALNCEDYVSGLRTLLQQKVSAEALNRVGGAQLWSTEKNDGRLRQLHEKLILMTQLFSDVGSTVEMLDSSSTLPFPGLFAAVAASKIGSESVGIFMRIWALNQSRATSAGMRQPPSASDEDVFLSGALKQIGAADVFLPESLVALEARDTWFSRYMAKWRTELSALDCGFLFSAAQIRCLLRCVDSASFELLSDPDIGSQLSTLQDFTLADVERLEYELSCTLENLYTCPETVVVEYLQKCHCLLNFPHQFVYAVHRKLWESEQFCELAWELLLLPSFMMDPVRADDLGLPDVLISTTLQQIFRHEHSTEANRALIWNLIKLNIIFQYSSRLPYVISSLFESHMNGHYMITGAHLRQINALQRRMWFMYTEQKAHIAEVFKLMSADEEADGSWLTNPNMPICSFQAVSAGYCAVKADSAEVLIAQVLQFKFITEDEFNCLASDPNLYSPDAEMLRKGKQNVLEYLDNLGARRMDRLLALVEKYAPNRSLGFVWSSRVHCVQMLRLRSLRNIIPRDHPKWTIPEWVIKVCIEGTVPVCDAAIAKQSNSMAIKFAEEASVQEKMST